MKIKKLVSASDANVWSYRNTPVDLADVKHKCHLANTGKSDYPIKYFKGARNWLLIRLARDRRILVQQRDLCHELVAIAFWRRDLSRISDSLASIERKVQGGRYAS